MKTILIYVVDNAKLEENEKIGFEMNKVKPTLIPFSFNEKHFVGYWVDPDENDDTGAFDIIFYMGGDVFKTPYKKETEELFKSILNS
jgi:hypothetical protein